MQLTPSPVKPSRQAQVNPPPVLVHVAFTLQLWVPSAHSSTSACAKEHHHSTHTQQGKLQEQSGMAVVVGSSMVVETSVVETSIMGAGEQYQLSQYHYNSGENSGSPSLFMMVTVVTLFPSIISES